MKQHEVLKPRRQEGACPQIRPGNNPGRNPDIAFSEGRIRVLRPEIIAEIGAGPTLVNQKAGRGIGPLIAEN
jgi:hypothetical protein